MSKHFNEAVEGDDGGLVICRGCKASGTYAALPSGECPTPYKPDSVLLNESLAREQALQQRLTAADQQTDDLRAELAANPKPDPVLCKFYDVDDWPGLVRELVGHVAQLQESAKRNVKPWEDTFPPTLLPAYIERVNTENACAQPKGEQLACMPVERCYDVRAKMIIAFNEAKKAGGDLDDALDAAHKSALRYSQNPMSAEQPASVAVSCPTHANPPPGSAPCGTHRDNDGLDEMRKPAMCDCNQGRLSCNGKCK